MVQHGLSDGNLKQIHFLFLGNVGNLICPLSYDFSGRPRMSHRTAPLRAMPKP